MTLPNCYRCKSNPCVCPDGITLYHGDARDILPLLEAGSVEGFVTDPPYGINFDRATWEDGDIEGYGNLMRWLVGESRRIVSDGPVFIWQALPNWPHWHEWFPADSRIFASCKGFVQFRPVSIQWSWDPVLFWGKPLGRPTVNLKDWYVQKLAPFGAHRPKIKHPCPKPPEIVKQVVNATGCTTILDPFAGSGTTGRACKDLGRKCIMVEIEEKYCEIAARRLDQEIGHWMREPKTEAM